jgi:DNA repair protein SbcC/Rad50
VTELLGLGFDAFSSSVLLAQGQFSKFLAATPKERGVILKGIFRLDQIDDLQKAAKARRDALEVDLKLIEGERNAIPGDVALRLKRARAEEKEASARAASLEKAIPREKALLEELSGISRRRAEVELSIETATKIGARLPEETELARLVAEQSDFQIAQKEGAEAVRVAEEAQDQAVAKHEALEGSLGAEVDLADARGHVRARDDAAAKISKLTAQRSKEVAAAEAAAEAAGLAQRRLAEAEATLTTVREQESALGRMHAAHGLREGLVVGDPCPVCEQTVATIPQGEAPAEMGEIAARVREAVSSHASASASERAAALERGRLAAVLEATAHGIATLEAERERSAEELIPLLGDPDTAMAEIDARLAQIRASRLLVTATRDAATRERARMDKLRNDAATLEKRHVQQSHRLIELFAQLHLPAPAMDAPGLSLTDHAAAIRAEVTSRVEAARVSLASLESDIVAKDVELQRLRKKLDLPPEATIEAVFADARSAAEVAKNEAATAEKQLARSKELSKEETKVKARRSLFKVLTTDLTAQQFIAFLLEERTKLLLELGSERLHTMTGNRYRLELDEKNELEVVDELDADKRRSVDTLSGGETFLASLALAIALAEVVTRAGGRLQCFFLDEGFGTLDPESFDLAMDGIERIVTDGRLIGLVSHVPALRDRVEDQIVLEKGEDGMSRIAAGGS